MRRNTHCFTVEGSGEFPFDMLRYDSCWPYEGQDAGNMANHERHRRRIALQTDGLGPTAKRWESFNWSVVESNGVERQ